MGRIKTVNIILNLSLFLIPAIGMFSGLSAGFSVPLFLIIYFLKYGDYKNLFPPLSKYFLEFLFLFWLCLSCFWSEKPMDSLLYFLRIFPFIILAFSLKETKQTKKFDFALPLFFGCLFAILGFFVEYSTSGFFSTSFRKFFGSENQKFYLYSLDRGCAILSMVFWPLAGYFLKKKKYIFTALSSCSIVLVLYLSDSLASFAAFLLASIVFFLIRIGPNYIPKFINISIILTALALPSFFYFMDPAKISAEAGFLPFSAKHRLFIWNFVAKKYIENPIAGKGMRASAYFQDTEENSVHYEGTRLPLLPLHPHNNFLQILFETGIIGFTLFLSIIYEYLTGLSKIKDPDYKACAYSAISCYLIIGSISFSVWQVWWVFIASLVFLSFSKILSE